MPKTSTEVRAWIAEAVRCVEADANRSADTHLHRLNLPTPGVDVYLKDESVHPTGSLKHRLARSLFLYSLCNGWIGPDTTIVEASSGSTAVSEAYFAGLLNLPFIAVMPHGTSEEKIALIEWYGGTCHFVDSAPEMYPEAKRLAAETGGHYMDQFTYAERATDWRGNNNIAESIFDQMSAEPHPIPSWIVMSAGTGGTSATIGRFIRYRRFATRLMVADPEGSAFLEGWQTDSSEVTTQQRPRIEGIGRPRVEPSFVGGVVDDMMRVPDAASIATMRWVSQLLGRPVGPSTGTNVWAVLNVASHMVEAGKTGSIVSMICDGGDRYRHSYFDDQWVADGGFDLAPWLDSLAAFGETGVLTPPANQS
ncbi:MAG: PLP-dependent cysteine synthase family protein [Actinomycetales bacterium]|nr:PLP-dependent cysteine synthase family protein [Actinomycetales bacterium]